jgi:hypothetical protein
MGYWKRGDTKVQLVRLFYRQNKLCHWCGKQMLHPGSHKGKKGHRDPPMLCTLDHLDSRLSHERGKHAGEYRRVAACWKCNNDRAKQEQASLPKESLWARSGAYPMRLKWLGH